MGGAKLFNKHAFTIVELLIVIVVIAVLAAISIVGYNAVRNNADKSAVFAQLKHVGDLLKVQILNDTIPLSLDNLPDYHADSKLPTTYMLYDANTTYCLSAKSGTQSYFVWSDTNDATPQEGSCTEVSSIDKNSFLVFTDTSGHVPLKTPISGNQDVILYSALTVVNLNDDYRSIAGFLPATNSNRLRLDTNSSGYNGLRSRVDTSAITNATHSKPARSIGGHIGWVMVRSNSSIREYNYDAAPPFSTLNLAPNSGFSFNELSLSSSTSSTQPLAAAAFMAAHDQKTRQRVLDWFSKTYSIPLAP